MNLILVIAGVIFGYSMNSMRELVICIIVMIWVYVLTRIIIKYV